MKQRRIVWFSCGAASAVAAKVTVEKHPDTQIVYCDTSKSEHPDNMRFLLEVGAWVGKPIDVIASEKYRTVEEVFEKRKYMSGPAGAICTVEMKKIPRFHFQRPDDIHIFGFTADERARIERFRDNNPELYLEWPLLEAGVVKQECYNRIEAAGITLPAMYRLGYNNNNCIGCVKATSMHYWMKVRHDFPEKFAERARQSRAIGCRLAKMNGKRVFLDELPPEGPLLFDDSVISCGPECGNVA